MEPPFVPKHEEEIYTEEMMPLAKFQWFLLDEEVENEKTEDVENDDDNAPRTPDLTTKLTFDPFDSISPL